MVKFNHFNFNVLNLEKSLEFYEKALGLKPVREKDASDGSFKLVYLGDGLSDFTLELTWLKAQNPTIWVSANSIWLSMWMIMTRSIKSTRKWAASAMKIRLWEFISFPIRMDTGLRLFRKTNKEGKRKPASALKRGAGFLTGCVQLDGAYY